MAKSGSRSKNKRSSNPNRSTKNKQTSTTSAALSPETVGGGDNKAEFGQIPTIKGLIRRSYATLRRAPILFSLVTASYVLFDAVFVRGLSSGVDVNSLHAQFGGQLIGNLATDAGLLASGAGGNSSNGSGVYQLILFIIFSLALVWTLRQLQSSENGPRLRDAFYKGMYPLIPVTIVGLVFVLELLPMFIGLTLYVAVITGGIAVTALEKTLWGIGILGLIVMSLYLLVSTIFALYIATLPDMTPLKAIRSANRLVRRRRSRILGRLLFLPALLILVCGVILFPFIIAIPVISPWILLVLGGMTLTISHTYLYSLYRGLLGE